MIPVFSGDRSVPFWNWINRRGTGVVWNICYDVGIVLQRLERRLQGCRNK